MSSSKTASLDVKDKVILVTGANRGIGKAFVDGVLKHGAKKVYAAVRTIETASMFEKEEQVTPVYIDLAKPESIQQAASKATDVEIIINNAGVLSRTNPLSKDAVSNLQHEMSVNVYGMIHMAQAFAEILKQNGGGAFVQINSVASMRCALPEASTYSASKAAAYSITQALRQSMTDTRIVSVHPGPIDTDMIKAVGLSHLAESPEQVADEVVEALRTPNVFHVYPDSKSKLLGETYKTYATEVIEAGRLY